MLSGELAGVRVLSGEIGKDVVRSGGGGTTNYNNLGNKPQINGVELKGNKTSEELGLANKSDIPVVPTKVSAFENDAGYLREVPSEYVTDEELNEKGYATTVYVDDEISDVREVAEGKTKSFTVETLSNLGVLLGIDTSIVADEYTITSTTINYKEKNIELKQGDLFLIVDTSVPDYWVSVDDMKIYKMETTKVDLTDYVKFTDYASGQKAGVGLSSSTYGVFRSTSNNYWTIKSASNDEINAKTDKYKPIVPANLDYAVKVSLTTNVNELTEEEKNKVQTWLGVPQIELTQIGDNEFSLDINTEV